MRTLYLDLETTGLDPAQDEILEIALLDADGQPLLDTLVRPQRQAVWPAAQCVNGIAPAAVADAPALATLRPRLRDLVRGARVVMYNAPFDTAFLPDELALAARRDCAMRAYAAVRGEWRAASQDWRWWKLTEAAAAIGFVWRGHPHRARADALATRAVWHYCMQPAHRALCVHRVREAARYRAASPAPGPERPAPRHAPAARGGAGGV